MKKLFVRVDKKTHKRLKDMGCPISDFARQAISEYDGAFTVRQTKSRTVVFNIKDELAEQILEVVREKDMNEFVRYCIYKKLARS